jgi:ParB/RepB/Spo0J family partition protein
VSSSMKKVEGYIGHSDLFKVDPRKIAVRDGWNPRTFVDTDRLEELKASMRDNGFYSDKPLLLHRSGDQLTLISGHRRLQAVLELIDEGIPFVSVPAVLDQTGDEGERLARALAANQNGVPLEPLDEAHAFKRLVGYGWEPKRIAAKVGRSLSHVYGRLKLLEADPDVLEAVEKREITTSDAVKVVEQSGKSGSSQTQALAHVKEKRQAKRQGKDPNAQEERDAAIIKYLLDTYPLGWVMGEILAHVEEEEVLEWVEKFIPGATPI